MEIVDNDIFNLKKITFIFSDDVSNLFSFINEEASLIFKNINLKKIGFLDLNSEDYFLCDTVYEELLYVLKKNKLRVDYDKKIINALKMVGLDDSFLNRILDNLSGGEKKKVALAKVLVCNPKVLVLNEPFIHLDYFSKNEIMKLFRMMKLRYGKTIIILTNNSDDALKLADYVKVYEKGQMVFNGDKFDFFKDRKLLKAFNISEPKMIEFTYLVQDKKKINIGFRDDMNDLIKDIYRFVK